MRTIADKQGRAAPAKGSKNLTPVLIVLVGVLIVAVCVFGFLMLNRPQPAAEPAGRANVLTSVDPNAVDAILDEMDEAAKDSNLIVSMSSVLEFEDGGKTGRFKLENVQENKYAFTVTLVLADGERTVLETGLIPPGNKLNGASLSETLPPGDYPASAYYTTYDDEGVEKGRVGVAVTIRVKN